MRSSKTHNKLRVRVYWGDILYDTALFEPSARVQVGKSRGSRFLADVSRVFPEGPWPLVDVEKNGASVTFHSSLQGFIKKSGKVFPLRSPELHSQSKEIADQTFRLHLTEQDQANLSLGDLSFYVDWTEKQRRLPHLGKVFTAQNAFWGALITTSVICVTFLKTQLVIPRDTVPLTRTVTLLPKTEVDPLPVIAEPLPPEPEPVKESAPPVAVAPAPAPAPKTKRPMTKLKAAPAPAPAAPVESQGLELGDVMKNLSSVQATAPRRRGSYVPGGAAGVAVGPSHPTKALEAQGLDSVQGGEGNFASSKGLGLKGEAKARGPAGLSTEAIESVMKTRQMRIQQCYERELSANPGLRGMISFRFVIGGDGRVTTSRVIKDELGSAPVASCIVREVRALKFQEPAGGRPVTFDYPFNLEPSDG